VPDAGVCDVDSGWLLWQAAATPSNPSGAWMRNCRRVFTVIDLSWGMREAGKCGQRERRARLG